jgi:DNA-binding NarL/FixJ family response regulator
MAPILSVLVADNSASFLHAMGQAIGQEPGLRLLTLAQSATEAFDWFVRCRPDVVIIPVSLPDRSGYELLRLMRQADTRCLLILVRRELDPLVAQVGHLLGANEVWSKTEEPRQLWKLLRRSIRAWLPVPPAASPSRRTL